MGAAPHAPLQGGVTLIELAVLVALFAVVLAIGIPGYRHHVLRAKSVDATRELRTLSQRLEACHRRTGSYTRLDDSRAACVSLPYAIPEGTYAIGGEIEEDSFALTASPLGSQMADAQCRAFVLDQQGRRQITGTGTVPACWGRPD